MCEKVNSVKHKKDMATVNRPESFVKWVFPKIGVPPNHPF